MRTVFLSAFLHECRPLVAPHAAHFRCQTEHVFSRSACPHMKTAPGEAVLLEHEKLGVPAARGRTHVTSFGGVGTSALMLALSAAGAAINSGGDCDGVKHLPFGRLMREKASHMLKNPPVSRILYVYDDPTDAVMSLFRRGYNWDQLDKTRSDLPAPASPETLQEYAEREDDPFQFEAHFDSFATQRAYPIAFVQQSRALQHAGDLADFLQLNGTRLRAQLEAVMGKQRPQRRVALLSRTNRTAFAPGSRRALVEPARPLQPSEPPAEAAAATVAATATAAAAKGLTGGAGLVTAGRRHVSRHASIVLFGSLEHACQHCLWANRKACTAGQCNQGGGLAPALTLGLAPALTLTLSPTPILTLTLTLTRWRLDLLLLRLVRHVPRGLHLLP